MKPRYTRSELGRVDGRGQEESISRKRRRRGKRQGRCKRDPIHSGGESSQAAEDEERTSRTDLDILSKFQDQNEIPGFYYDPEKKKYFKIQPNQFSSLGHTVTKQNIEKKTKETARIQKLNKQTDKVHAHHFLDLVSRQAMGDLSKLQFQRYFIHKRISCIDNYPSQTLNAISSYGTLEHPKVMGLNSNCDKLISMWSLASSLAKCINFVDINSDSTGDTVIDFNKPCLNLCICASSMFWTETKNSLPLHLLYTTEPYFGNENCTAHICQVSNQGFCGTTNSYSLGQQYVWCCALDSDYRSFCIGCQKGALLIEVETRRLWEIGAHKSNVSSTVFTNKSPSILYCGNTKGLIFSHDTRSHANQTPGQLKMKGIVTSLQLTGDDIHLLASDTLGNAYLWDLRMKKVLVEYKGMKNESTRIPLHLDDGEKLVYGCDLEGYTRLWCKTSGKLLRTIPSPVPCSSTSVPAVLYCENLGNRPGNSAVILGAGNKLYVYKV